jgi:hypothetical protein
MEKSYTRGKIKKGLAMSAATGAPLRKPLSSISSPEHLAIGVLCWTSLSWRTDYVFCNERGSEQGITESDRACKARQCHANAVHAAFQRQVEPEAGDHWLVAKSWYLIH